MCSEAIITNKDVINLVDKYKDDIDFNKERDQWVKRQNNLVFKNSKYDLKSGDVIYFKNGYDVPMCAKIIAFSEDLESIYLDWDCYWCPIKYTDRVIDVVSTIEITDEIRNLNKKSNTLGNIDMVLMGISALNNSNSVDFLYYKSIDNNKLPMQKFSIWQDVLCELSKQNIFLRVRECPLSSNVVEKIYSLK